MNFFIKKYVALCASAFMLMVGCSTAEPQVFEPTVESLQQYECPEWFRDAKFGIWSCWNAYTVPGQGDWYARNMYMEGSRAYNYHCKTYGHPSEVGYKDVVDMWKGENFNPKEQMELFKAAGAKYFVAMANHHDNFDLWDSKYQPWNSVNYGPKRDIIAEWQKITLDAGLRWGITSHLERTWSWFQVNKLADTKGKYKGVPYDGADPQYEQIYLPKEPTGDTSGSQPINATEWWRQHWLDRCTDLIDNYKPDLFYVDGGVPFPGDDKGATGLKMISHLYSQNAKWHGGQNEAVMCLKNWYHIAPRGEWGFYWDGIGTLDYECGRSSEILPEPWQTDTNIGAWTWLPNMKYRSAYNVLCELVDVVSKNGNLLVNVSPRPDGTLDEGATALLKSIGAWMKVNSESIYDTRPWLIYGVDKLRVVKVKERGDILYVSSLVKPKGASLNIPFLKSPKGAKIDKVTLLASGEPLEFEQTKDGLSVTLPKRLAGEHIWVFKIEGESLTSYDVEEYKAAKRRDVEQEINIWYDMSHKDQNSDGLKAVAFDKYATKWAIDSQDRLVSFEGGDPKVHPYKVQDLDYTVSGYGGFVTLDGEVYYGKLGDIRQLKNMPKSTRLSIAEDGTLWVVAEDMSLVGRTVTGELKPLKSFKTKDVTCGTDGQIALVDQLGRIRFMKDGRVNHEAAGVNITRIDYSPKTEHLIAIYDGELAIFKDRTWSFKGVKVKDVSGGKSNDDEIVGWVE